MPPQKTVPLITPYGDKLVDLLPAVEERAELEAYGNGLPSLRLSPRSVCDLEMLACGGFSPLDHFMGREDYQSVIDEMRLSSGHLFSIPVTLPVQAEVEMHLDQDLALRDLRNELLAVMTVEEIYPWDQEEAAHRIFGTQDLRHPLVAEMHRWGRLNISGKLRVVRIPRHLDFHDLRLTPAETRSKLEDLARLNVVAFQTRNPLHRAHEEMTKRAIAETDGVLLLHPAVGKTRPRDVDHYTRVRSYRALASNYFSADRILLSLLPLAMRLAGPKEALWHALIRRNYGANHMIVGRDHASPGLNSKGEAFYEPYEAQIMMKRFADELGVKVFPFREFVYLPEEDRYVETSSTVSRSRIISVSGTRVREDYLSHGKQIPDWLVRPEVAEILAETYLPQHRQGVCIWFTGLSGAGKSTTAEGLTSLLLEHGRQVTLLDGDVVRTNLSKGLGFTKQDRNTNVRRIGFVAAEIVRHGGVVLCAAVSPYRATRNDVRNMVGSDQFVEVFVDTPLEVCEARDTKGIYAKARRGEIKGFTGIDDPYERPQHAEITLDTLGRAPHENALQIVRYLTDRGYLRAELDGEEPDRR